jgi:hypothetical protein
VETNNLCLLAARKVGLATRFISLKQLTFLLCRFGAGERAKTRLTRAAFVAPHMSGCVPLELSARADGLGN